MRDAIRLDGLDKAAVLAALYNRAEPRGMGLLHYNPKPMTVEEANAIGPASYFDYLSGRAMKVDLSGETLDPHGYDRYYGEGACQAVIETLRQTNNPNAESLASAHQVGAAKEKQRMEREIHQPTPPPPPGTDDLLPGVPTFHLGLGDIKEELQAAIDALGKEANN